MVVGIDLGTTNSAIGIWRDGRAQLIPNSLGSVLTPSAVSVDDGGEFVIGLAARERQITHPTLLRRPAGALAGLSGQILHELQ
jgi:molecular chaperone HscC